MCHGPHFLFQVEQICHSSLSITGFLNAASSAGSRYFVQLLHCPFTYMSLSLYKSFLFIVLPSCFSIYSCDQSSPLPLRVRPWTSRDCSRCSYHHYYCCRKQHTSITMTYLYNKYQFHHNLRGHCEALITHLSYTEGPHKSPPFDTQQGKSSYIAQGDLSSPLLSVTIHHPSLTTPHIRTPKSISTCAASLAEHNIPHTSQYTNTNYSDNEK